MDPHEKAVHHQEQRPDTSTRPSKDHPAVAKAKEHAAAAQKAHDSGLHHASGTVHNVNAHGSQYSPHGHKATADATPVDTKGGTSHAQHPDTSTTTTNKSAHHNRNKEKETQKQEWAMPNWLRPLGAGSIGSANAGGPSSASGDAAAGGGTSPVVIGVVLLAVVVGGFFLWHKLHAASASEKTLDAGGRPSDAV